MFNFKSITFNELVATNTTNYHEPTEEEIKSGLEFEADIVSDTVNSYLYKLSAAVKNLQENGCVSYIPGKEYFEGNIVYCPILDGYNLSIEMFRCKKDNTINIHPMKELVNDDNNGYIYLVNSEVNSSYWDKIQLYNEYVNNIKLKDYTGKENDSIIKNYKLFTCNNDGCVNYFDIIIKRQDKYAKFRLECSGYNKIPQVNITKVTSNAYDYFSSDNIWSPNSIFKDIALLGSFISIKDSNVYLTILPNTGVQETIDIKIKSDNIKILTIESEIMRLITDLNIIKCPIVNNCNNSFDKSLNIIESFESYTKEYMFKNGLVELDNTEKTFDNMQYSFIKYYNNFRNTIKSNDLYFRTYDESANTYKVKKLPKVTAVSMQMTVYQYDGPSYDELWHQYNFTGIVAINPKQHSIGNRKYAAKNNAEGIFQLPDGIEFHLNNLDEPETAENPYLKCANGMLNGVYKGLDSAKGIVVDTSSYSLVFEANGSNNIYSAEDDKAMFLDTVKVHRYIKLF